MARKDSFLFRLCRSDDVIREARVNTFYADEIFSISKGIFCDIKLKKGDIVSVKNVTGMSPAKTNENNGFKPVAMLVDETNQDWENLTTNAS